MAVKFSGFTSSGLNSTGFIVGYDSSTNQNIRIPKSTLDSTYQATLVSATNIKTINGSTILGSGDLVVGGGGGSATGLQTAVFGTLFSLPTNAAANCSNQNSFSQGNANALAYYPYIPNVSFTCTQFAITVNGVQPTGLARICVYSSVNGQPGNLLYNSADLDCSTTGNKSAVSSFAFTQGTVYWLALHTNVTGMNFAGISKEALLQLGTLSGNPITMWVQVSATYTSGAPSVAAPNSFNTQAAPTIFMSK